VEVTWPKCGHTHRTSVVIRLPLLGIVPPVMSPGHVSDSAPEDPTTFGIVEPTETGGCKYSVYPWLPISSLPGGKWSNKGAEWYWWPLVRLTLDWSGEQRTNVVLRAPWQLLQSSNDKHVLCYKWDRLSVLMQALRLSPAGSLSGFL